MRTGSQWVADVVARRGRMVGGLGVRLLWSWVRQHPWEAGRVLQVMDTARDPRVSSAAAGLVERAWVGGAMRPELRRAIATHAVPFPPQQWTHPARRVMYAHFTGDADECRRLDPDGRILDRCLGRPHGYEWYLDPERRWTADAERERELHARRHPPGFIWTGGSGQAGGPTSAGGGGRGVPGSAYGTGGHGSIGFGGSF